MGHHRSLWMRAFGRGVWALVAGVLVYAAGAVAGEGTAGAAADPVAGSMGPVALIASGGLIGGVLLLLSVIALGLGIEHAVTLKREKLFPEDVFADIERALDSGEYQEAVEICETEDCVLTRVVGAGLTRTASGFERMQEAMASEADAQAEVVLRKLGYLNLIAGIAPMLGLFGTVWGMIQAFQRIAIDPNPGAPELASGIYVALVTTFLGLLVAIPTLAAFSFFRNRATGILTQVGLASEEILDRFRPVA